MKTFIRRPGNKSSHLKHILPLLPDSFGTYIEPFLGTGALFLHLKPDKWIISDLNKDITLIWKLVRDKPEYINQEINKFKEHFLKLTNEEKLRLCQSIAKKLSNNAFGKNKRTVMYLLMIYCSFNGSLEKDNVFHVGSLYTNLYYNRSVHIFTDMYSKKIIELSKFLQKGKIYNKDYREVFRLAKEGDFVFIDPPYIEDRKYAFKYNNNEITFDINNLALELKKLDNRGVKWMMTQVYTPEIKKLFSGYRTVTYINKLTFANKNKPKTEVIIMNYSS